MRITAEAKVATNQRILEAAARLFRTSGWENTTTREIASAAGIATGTLFNYFPTKEAIAAVLISESLEKADEDFTRAADDDASLEEDLFRFVWSGLKRLREHRGFLGAAAETIFSPLARSSPERSGDAIRVRHLETVERIVAVHRPGQPLRAVSLQLYWTLYLGIFAYWAADRSPKQEDTLALLDQALKLFLAALEKGSPEKGSSHDE